MPGCRSGRCRRSSIVEEETFRPCPWISSPSNVFPVAIAREDAIEPAVVILTTNAPRKIAGQTQYPSRRNAARLIPVGGHSGVALG